MALLVYKSDVAPVSTKPIDAGDVSIKTIATGRTELVLVCQIVRRYDFFGLLLRMVKLAESAFSGFCRLCKVQLVGGYDFLGRKVAHCCTYV